MFSHITVGVRDLAVSTRFYDAVLSHLGLVRNSDYDESTTSRGWMQPGLVAPFFYAHIPANGLPTTWGNGTQVSFIAPSRHALDTAFEAVIAHGGFDEGKPGPRTGHGEGYYAAYCRDPDGNKLCFVHTETMARSLHAAAA